MLDVDPGRADALAAALTARFGNGRAVADHARAVGYRHLNGDRMVVHQAAEAMRLFTGLAPDTSRMLRHLAELLRR